MTEWMNRTWRSRALGVRPQTLYAYVSRGRIGPRPDPDDPRRSLYRADDVAALVERRAPRAAPRCHRRQRHRLGRAVDHDHDSTIRHGQLSIAARRREAVGERDARRRRAAALGAAGEVAFWQATVDRRR